MVDNAPDTLTRGELARQCAVNFETIRYYEQRGLIPRAARSAGNYRLYRADTVRRVRFIKRAQELGFTLKEIKELLALRATTGTHCADVRKRAEVKVADIHERIRTLQAMQKALTKLVGQCSGKGPVTGCPILEALDAEDGA